MQITNETDRIINGTKYHNFEFRDYFHINDVIRFAEVIIDAGFIIEHIRIEGYGDVDEGDSYQATFDSLDEYKAHYIDYYPKDTQYAHISAFFGNTGICAMMNLKESMLSVYYDLKSYENEFWTEPQGILKKLFKMKLQQREFNNPFDKVLSEVRRMK